MSESIGNLHGPDAAWARAMIGRLEARGCSSSEVNQAVIFVDDTCARVKRGPHAEFGDPLAFADRLQFPLQPARVSPLHTMSQMMGASRVHVGGILLVVAMLLATMATAFAAGNYASGAPGTTVTAGVPFAFMAIIALLFSLMALPTHRLARHAVAVGFGMMAVIIVVIVISVLWTQPILWIPRGIIAGLGIGLGSLTFAGFMVAGLRCRRNDEPELARHLFSTGALTPLLIIGTSLLVYFG